MAADCGRWSPWTRRRGRSTTGLQRHGKLANTYFIFTSDNGFHLGQHRLGAGKSMPYETDIKVPFLIRGPGIRAGLRLSHLASNADVAPTVAELAGVRAGVKVDGRSLASLLLGRPGAGDDWRHLVPIASYPQTTASSDTARFRFRGLRSRWFTYVEHATGARELYDNRSDPLQLDNLAPRAEGAFMTELARLTRQLMTCAAATCRTTDAQRIRGRPLR